MGDKYELSVKCAHCGKHNKDVYYAPTCAADTFLCEHCKEYNFITSKHEVKKTKDVTYEDVEEGFLATTSYAWSDEEIKNICNAHLKDIKKNETRNN